MTKKVTMKRKDLYSFNATVPTADFVLPIKTSFRYATSKNVKLIASEIKEIDALFPVPEGFSAYLDARAAVFNKSAVELDRYGNPNMDSFNKLNVKSQESLNAALTELIEQNKEMLDTVNSLNTEKLAFIDGEIEIDLVTVPLSDVPDISDKNDPTNHWELWRNLEFFID